VRHSEHWAVSPGMRQLKLFVGKPFDKLSRDRRALGRKQCRLATGLLNGHCTLRQYLHIMGLLDSAKCRKCGQEESTIYSVNAQRWLRID
jgi:hypothetical protein